MGLLEQVLEKKLELYDELVLNHYTLRGIWVFYSYYNLALSITGEEDMNIRRKNRLWKRLLFKKLEGKNDLEIYDKLMRYMKEDIGVIIKALKLTHKESERLKETFGLGLYKPGTLAIISYEMPE